MVRRVYLDFSNGLNELKEYAKLRKKFGDGESAVMAIAKTWNCAVASDDMTATRKFCRKNNIEQIGTLGILYYAFDNGLIDIVEANSILTNMKLISNYKCPVKNFSEVIDWFKNGIGI